MVCTLIGICVTGVGKLTTCVRLPFSNQVVPPSILILSVLSFVLMTRLPVSSLLSIVTSYFILPDTCASTSFTANFSNLCASSGSTTTTISTFAPVSFWVTVIVVSPSAAAFILAGPSTVTISVSLETQSKSSIVLLSCFNTLYLSEVKLKSLLSFVLIKTLFGDTVKLRLPTRVYTSEGSVVSFPSEPYWFGPTA